MARGGSGHKPRQVKAATESPCVHCPWRIENHGKRHPDGWYTKANLRSLWARLRRGDGMTCHPTDPDNPVSEAAQRAGYRPAPPGSQVRRCAGAVILQQREVQVLDDILTAGGTLADYRAQRPGGLTTEGLWTVAAGAAFEDVPLLGGVPMGKPNLNEPVGVPHHDLPWEVRRR
jgi:hypothetical protein